MSGGKFDASKNAWGSEEDRTGEQKKRGKKVNEEKNTGVVLPCLLPPSHLPSSPQLHFLLFSCVGVETKTEKKVNFCKDFFNSLSTKLILVLSKLHLVIGRKKPEDVKQLSVMYLFNN